MEIKMIGLVTNLSITQTKSWIDIVALAIRELFNLPSLTIAPENVYKRAFPNLGTG